MRGGLTPPGPEFRQINADPLSKNLALTTTLVTLQHMSAAERPQAESDNVRDAKRSV